MTNHSSRCWRRAIRIARLASFLLVALSVCATFGDVQVELKRGEGRREDYYYRMTVTPASKPSPIFKHRLLIPESERKPGNAATAFYRALITLRWNVQDVYRDHPGSERHYSSLFEDVSSDDFRVDRARDVVAVAKLEEEVLPGLREAARRTDCVWDRQLHNMSGRELTDFLLPDVQDSRECISMLGLLGRLQIAEGKLDAALGTMQLQAELAIDIGQPPHVIANLIARAWINVLHEQFIHYVGAEGSPNLYWALAELPQPLIPFRGAARYETTFCYRVIPQLKSSSARTQTPADWNRALDEWKSAVQEYGEELANDETQDVWVALKRLLQNDQETYVYPVAKERLLGSGVARDRIEAMPYAQVIMMDADRELERVLHEYEKWVYMPIQQARADMEVAKAKLADLSDCRHSYGALLGRLHLPIFRGPNLAEMRTTRDLTSLQVIEALRMHAAESGSFPEQLQDITCVAVPDNPLTGRPFDYRIAGRTAHLDLPFGPGLVARHFELSLANKR